MRMIMITVLIVYLKKSALLYFSMITLLCAAKVKKRKAEENAVKTRLEGDSGQ
jgi:hypothetical protein